MRVGEQSERMKLIPALLIVGMFAVSGWAQDIPEDVVSYSPELVEKAESGDALAQYNLGRAYHKGKGVAGDYKEAVKWFIKSAEQGNSFGQNALGVCYRDGTGVAKDERGAVKWYIKSAEQGNAKGQGNLASCYKKGTGVGKDEREAVKWYIKSAEQGNAIAQFNLGRCYYKGEGVTQDYKEAVKWWTKSAEHGNAGGQCVLGICYYEGDGVTQDYKEAVKWFTKSAEQGDQTGQLLIAKCYERGVGVAKDPKEAVKRYIKASEKKTPGSLYYVAKSFQVMCLSGEDSERSEEGFKELSNLSFRGRGDIDNAFIGLGCMEVGAFDRAKEALFNSGNSFAPFSQNIDPKSMSLLLKDSPFRESVVEILCGDMETIGSGIFCGPDGLILTAAHVIAGQKEIHIRNAKMQTWVVQQICPGDFTQDLALIKTDARNHPYIQLADDDPEKGDEVKVIGHPLGVIHLIESTGSVRSPGSLEDIMILLVSSKSLWV